MMNIPYTCVSARNSHLARSPWIPLASVICGLLLLSGQSASAQNKVPGKPGTEVEDPALKPRREILTTKDNIKINAYYFPSLEGKDGIPVMIVHEWKGQAAPYVPLCMALREAGFAAVIVEYRGHGNSKTYTDRNGKEEPFNIATMGRNDVQAIVRYDLEEIKQFLKEENNAGRLNLNALCMIGVEEAAIMAGYWAIQDWAIPSVGRMKQGQDVKAMVYISPEKNHEGFSLNTAVSNRNLINLPTLIVAGKGSSQGSEAERVGSRLEGVKKKLQRGSVTGFEMLLPDTNLSGAALINDDATVIPKIVEFLKKNVHVSKTENPWIDRP